MLKYFFGCIFLLFAGANKIAFSQELTYREAKEFSHYFEKRNPSYASLFDLLGQCPQDAFIKYYTEVQVEVFRQKESYFIQIKANIKNVECLCRYKGFVIGDFIFADKINIEAEIKSNGITIAQIHLKDKDIFQNKIIFDTNLTSDLELANFQFSISEISYSIGEGGLKHFYNGINKVDNFFLFDSLSKNWEHRLDLIDLSNVDMLPIYQFQLKDIASEIKKYDSNEYELLLSKSGMDNGDYLQKRAFLFRETEDLALNLSKKMSVIDNLMFEKAKHYEEEHNIEKAIFYYNRTLDYNPLHCDALERLSDLYSHNNLHKENLELFKNLRIRGEDINCQSSLSGSVCDSMCMKAANLIEKKNYYDAIKFLDTLELLFYQIPDNTYLQTYQKLREQAQDGIYNSYFDVINRAVKGNKIELSKEYIYGLVSIMENDKNIPVSNPLFGQMMERFLSRYKENVKNTIKRKKYDEVIRGNDAMLVFLDSINYPREEELFFDSYSISCTGLYLEKSKQSGEEALMFLEAYRKYISLTADSYSEVHSEQEVKVEKKEKSLLDYALEWNIFADDDSSMMDSLRVHLINALSKVNQYAWTNEFSSAAGLMTKIESVIPLMNLPQDADVSVKYNQSSELLLYRINLRAEQEYNAFSTKIKQLVNQKQYLNAYSLLKNENLFLQKTVYQVQINHLLEEVELPALFQEKMLYVEQNLALGDLFTAFRQYEEAYNYFISNDISLYGLTCDSLFAFVKESKRESLLKGACRYYLAAANYISALDMMMYLVDSGYKTDDIQAKLGSAMKHSTYSFADLSKKYSFGKKHKIFLQNYIGKFRTFFLRLH